MTSAQRRRTVPGAHPSADAVHAPASGGPSAELRRMVLLLETAAVLEARARNCSDAGQVAVLLRRAGERRREAVESCRQLSARGAAMAAGLAGRLADSSARRPRFKP